MEELLTQSAAAKTLGVSTKTVGRFKSSGLLPSKRIGRYVKYPKEAVERLKAERDRGFTYADLRGEVAGLRYELERIKKQLKFLLLKNQISSVTWDFSDPELLSYYQAAETAPAAVTTDLATQWTEMALSLTEQEYRRMEALTGDPYPWRRFFEQCDRLIQKLRRKHGAKTNMEIHQAIQNLVYAQQEVRKCGLIMITAEPVKMPATERFDLLVSESKPSEPIDPDKLLKNMKAPSMATDTEKKKLTRLRSVFGVDPEDPHEDT